MGVDEGCSAVVVAVVVFKDTGLVGIGGRSGSLKHPTQFLTTPDKVRYII